MEETAKRNIGQALLAALLVALCLVVFPACAHASAASHAPGTLTVHYIDVGQGDSEFVELPDGKTLLIDAGTAKAGSTVVSYVKAQGYSRIDYLVATHPHEDHIGGMVTVMNSFDVGTIWAPNAINNTTTFEKFLKAAAPQGIETVHAGAQMDAGDGWTATFLSPKSTTSVSDLNDASAILDITVSGKRFLFTGDASSSVTRAATSGHVDVLKVGHHGSRTATDSALVASLTPSFAVISVGAGNTYGHPHAEVLSALAQTSVMRTDKQGTIVADCVGDSITFNVGVAESADAAAAEAATATNTETSGVTVYITATGKKYHADGCRFLSKSKIPLSLDDAKAQGYTACSVCGPPA